jgi:succinate dehydrogenase/fumarate reductase-like Fe-S protein
MSSFSITTQKIKCLKGNVWNHYEKSLQNSMQEYKIKYEQKQIFHVLTWLNIIKTSILPKLTYSFICLIKLSTTFC